MNIFYNNTAKKSGCTKILIQPLKITISNSIIYSTILSEAGTLVAEPE